MAWRSPVILDASCFFPREEFGMAQDTLPQSGNIGGREAAPLQVEQVKLLYFNLRNAIIINALLAPILVRMEYFVVGPARSFAWLAIMGAVLAVRIILAIRWARCTSVGATAPSWLLRFRVTVIATGMVWGASTLLLFPSGDTVHQAILTLVLGGMSTGSLTLLAVDRVSMLGFLGSTLAPLIARLAFEGGEGAIGMAAMAALYLLFVPINAAAGGHVLHESIRLRIRAEEQERAVRQSERRLNDAQHSAHIGNWELDLENNTLYWSDEIYRMFEIDPGQFGASYEAFLNAIHPDDRERVNNAYTGSLATREPYDIIHRLLFPGGRIKYVHERCQTWFDDNGKPLRSLGTVQDISEQYMAETALRDSEARYRALIQAASDAIITTDSADKIVGWNRGAEGMFGYSEAEALGKRLDLLIPRRLRPDHAAGVRRILAGGEPRIIGHGNLETVGMRREGGTFPLEMSLATWQSGGGRYFTGILRDISIRRKGESALRESEARFRFMLENSPIAAHIEDSATRQVVFANPRYAALLDSTPELVIGARPQQYYANPQDYTEIMERLDRGERVTNRLLELIIPSEHSRTKWVLASYLQLEYQRRPSVIGWLYDITDRKEMEEKIQHLAYHDPLTDLPNRQLFTDRLQRALASARRDKAHAALLFIDLDQFKLINDTLGHSVGDALLKEVAQRILRSLRDSDSVGRIGGDEFLVLLPDIRSEHDARTVADKLWSTLRQPFDLAGHKGLRISSSIGVAIYPEHGVDSNRLIANADTAMYHAKSAGRDNVQVYLESMRDTQDSPAQG
jgi:diguanylate cyclase (GGDEF)-like protein/PAS domain S-box-containing protein